MTVAPIAASVASPRTRDAPPMVTSVRAHWYRHPAASNAAAAEANPAGSPVSACE